jgi:spore coat protein A, manganese oxidase
LNHFALVICGCLEFAMLKSRVPVPSKLLAYRWATPLTIPARITLEAPNSKLNMSIGQTDAPHIFAVATSGKPAITGKAWGYGPAGQITSPGPTLITAAGVSCTVTWRNDLTRDATYPFSMPPRDFCAAGMMDRYATGHVVVHLHGAHLPWTSDGYPMRLPTTLTPGYANPTGHSAVKRPGQAHKCVYPNTQNGGATLWYHDHTMDRTARNVYAGLAGMYWLRHPQEGSIAVLPSGDYELPLMLHDMSFVEHPETKAAIPFYGDATYLDKYLSVQKSAASALGGGRAQLRKWRRKAGAAMAEFKGTTLCVNGCIWPSLDVEPRPYRFRVVNAATSRIFVLRVSSAAGLPTAPLADHCGNRDLDVPGLPIFQIGSDGGFLPETAALKGLARSTRSMLVLAPGERADIVIDFSAAAGTEMFLTNHAGERHPLGNGGDAADAQWSDDGTMGLTDVMRFNVKPGPVQSRFDVAAMNSALSILYDDSRSSVAGAVNAFVIKEFVDIPLTREDRNDFKRDGRFANGRSGWAAIPFQPDLTNTATPGNLWSAQPPTLKPPGQSEFGGVPAGGPLVLASDHFALNAPSRYWDIYNISADIHPIHIHHTQFRVVERRKIIKDNIKKLGPARPPDRNEQGWKDTIRSNNEEVVRIEVAFDDKSDGAHSYKGNYVMHCHLLDHEDMGMMRPIRID